MQFQDGHAWPHVDPTPPSCHAIKIARNQSHFTDQPAPTCASQQMGLFPWQLRLTPGLETGLTKEARYG